VIGALSKGDGNTTRAQGAFGPVRLRAVHWALAMAIAGQARSRLRRQLDSDRHHHNTGDRLIVTVHRTFCFATDSTQVQSGMQKTWPPWHARERVSIPRLQIHRHTDAMAKRPITATVRKAWRAVANVLVSNGVQAAVSGLWARGEAPVASNLNAAANHKPPRLNRGPANAGLSFGVII